MDSTHATTTMIRFLGEDGCDAVEIAGGKGASLSRMAAADVAVPPGFVVCAAAFARVLEAAQARDRIADLLDGLDVDRQSELDRAADRVRALIRDLPLPPDLEEAIAAAYGRLCADGAPVAVRSSAIAEDSGTASFAGQQQTFLNVLGAEEVGDRVRACWASFFGANALFYRRAKGSLADTAMAVVVQRLVTPDKSGVLFTADPITGRRDRMTVEAAWGFGEAVVSGLVVPDNYQLARPDGRLLRSLVPPKSIMLTRDGGGGLVETPVPPERSTERVLDDAELADLLALGERVEAFFGTPQDVEWAVADGRLYVLQSRPITTIAAGTRP